MHWRKYRYAQMLKVINLSAEIINLKIKLSVEMLSLAR